MASTQSAQHIDIHVTGNAVESGGNAWSLVGVNGVHVREGQDFTLPLLEVIAAAIPFVGRFAAPLGMSESDSRNEKAHAPVGAWASSSGVRR
jgi:hypothetical protein